MGGPRTVELYCGAGLLGAGFAASGFEPVFAADLNSDAVKTYNSNLAPVARVWDVRVPIEGLECDVILAGPPCQGFSTLGRRDTHDERNKLSLPVADWAIASKAKVVVIENVPQFVDSPYRAALVDRLAAHGFELTTWILEAYDYGTPQRRTRSFTILSRVGLPAEPVKARRRRTVKEAFEGIGGARGDSMDVAPVPSELAMKRIRAVPKNGDKRDIARKAPELCPPSWSRMGIQATDVWGRMDYDKPANTLRCCFQNPSKGRYIHPEEDRVITLREGARLQGIPDGWRFSGSRTSVAKQIGNGVPLPLAGAVGGAIADLFR